MEADAVALGQAAEVAQRCLQHCLGVADVQKVLQCIQGHVDIRRSSHDRPARTPEESLLLMSFNTLHMIQLLGMPSFCVDKYGCEAGKLEGASSAHVDEPL